MKTITSIDGTAIAYEKQGQGPAVVLVDGALCYRSFGPMSQLAQLLAPRFTVYHYDRRGRGDSGDSQPYALEREVEDLAALIDAAGGTAFVFGTSSGACLALEAAFRLGGKITKLALYEPPYNSDVAVRQAWEDYVRQLTGLLAADRRGDAVALFMALVGMPADQIEGMFHAPMWPLFEAIAPTLAYDAAAIGKDRSVPTGRAARVTVPTLVMNGGAGFAFMADTAEALARAIPEARHQILEDQTHDVNLEVLAPILADYFLEE